MCRYQGHVLSLPYNYRQNVNHSLKVKDSINTELMLVRTIKFQEKKPLTRF